MKKFAELVLWKVVPEILYWWLIAITSTLWFIGMSIAVLVKILIVLLFAGMSSTTWSLLVFCCLGLLGANRYYQNSQIVAISCWFGVCLAVFLFVIHRIWVDTRADKYEFSIRGLIQGCWKTFLRTNMLNVLYWTLYGVGWALYHGSRLAYLVWLGICNRVDKNTVR